MKKSYVTTVVSVLALSLLVTACGKSSKGGGSSSASSLVASGVSQTGAEATATFNSIIAQFNSAADTKGAQQNEVIQFSSGSYSSSQSNTTTGTALWGLITYSYGTGSNSSSSQGTIQNYGIYSIASGVLQYQESTGQNLNSLGTAPIKTYSKSADVYINEALSRQNGAAQLYSIKGVQVQNQRGNFDAYEVTMLKNGSFVQYILSPSMSLLENPIAKYDQSTGTYRQLMNASIR